jgi:S-adenosyl-L-methionine hydrolase (adenosine-forming)
MIVTLLTDFGTADYFVAAMKGVILGRAPGAAIVDVTHEVPPQQVEDAAFTLLAAYRAFPAGTVHVAVVDPGVGSARRAVVVDAGGHRFVGPDNGLFGWVIEREGGARVFHVTRGEHFRRPVSATFHGRDVFAPVAAALASGVLPDELGPEIRDFVRLPSLRPRRHDDGSLEARVLHVDRFGNVVTGFTADDLPPDFGASPFRIVAGEGEIRTLRRFYAEPGAESGEPFAIWGSAGFLELVSFRGSAAERLGLRRGDPVVIAFD